MCVPMKVSNAIESRRAYRSLEKIEITKDTVEELARAVQLAPSCFNNQPWNYVFVYDEKKLKEMHEVLTDGNEWATDASMIIAVFAKEEDDCNIYDRHYYLYDTGLGTAFLILKATEMGLVAHPIAGYSPKKTRKILGIPDEYNVINLVIVGKKSQEVQPTLNEDQVEVEKKRPERKELKEFVWHNSYDGD